MADRNIICVVGPTASGKTALAVGLAQALDGEVISCDSMQIYRGMDVGTAKPAPQEMQGIPHHMLDVCDPWEAFSVSRFVAMADPILQDILRRGKTAILAGGTGLYIDSLVAGRSFAPMPATGQRERLEALADEAGTEAVLQLLQTVDPESAARLHPADRKRIIRACEVYLETGQTISQHNAQTRLQPPRYDPVWLGLDFADRRDLYARINRRVDRMLADGLLQETAELLAAGVPDTATAMQAIGYKELVPVLRGTADLGDAVELMKRSSRRYAKRQLTWFRRNAAVHWLHQEAEPDPAAVCRQALDVIAAGGQPADKTDLISESRE